MPSERTKPIFLRLPHDLDDYVRKVAKKEKKTAQQVIQHLITKEMILKGK